MNEPKKEDYSLYDLWMYHADYKLWADKQIAELKDELKQANDAIDELNTNWNKN